MRSSRGHLSTQSPRRLQYVVGRQAVGYDELQDCSLVLFLCQIERWRPERETAKMLQLLDGAPPQILALLQVRIVQLLNFKNYPLLARFCLAEVICRLSATKGEETLIFFAIGGGTARG